MSENQHFIKSANFENNIISPTDRWILACLVKGLQGKEDISKISIEKIVEYCQYTDKDGKRRVFGRKAVEAAILRLEEAGMISIIKPAKKGQCTRYKINKIEHFEKLSEEFFSLNLPPIVKGYILCALQSNMNRDEKTYEPNSIATRTTFNLLELSQKYNMPIPTIYKVEKFLKDAGIMTISQDPLQRKDAETGLVLQNRSIDLDKVGLGEFVVHKLIEHEERLNNTYTKEESDDRMRQLIREAFNSICVSDAKEVEFKKE